MSSQSLAISLSPSLIIGVEEARAVLNWGKEPNDLDLHAVEVRPEGPSVNCEVDYL